MFIDEKGTVIKDEQGMVDEQGIGTWKIFGAAIVKNKKLVFHFNYQRLSLEENKFLEW